MNTAASACYMWEFAKAVVPAMEKAERTPHSAYVADIEIGMDNGEGDEELVADHEWQGAASITLPKSVPKQMAAALRRVHQNLGHPSNTDLARHLRLSAADAAVKGEKLRCFKMPAHEETWASKAGETGATDGQRRGCC